MGRGKRQGASRGLIVASYAEPVEAALKEIAREGKALMNMATLTSAAVRQLGIGEGLPGQEGARTRKAAAVYAFNYGLYLLGRRDHTASRSRYLDDDASSRIRGLVAACHFRWLELLTAAKTPDADIIRIPDLEDLMRVKEPLIQVGARSRMSSLAASAPSA
jgi:hypothetical protein